MKPTLLLALSALALTPRPASANDDPAVTELASAIGVPALQRVGRVAIVTVEPDSAEAARFRTLVANAFVRADHPVVWGREPLATAEPDGALLLKYWTEQHASGVAVVRLSPPFEQSHGSVVLYDVGGAPLFKAFANRPGATATAAQSRWTAWPILDPDKFPGRAFYEQIGRQDLALSYDHRQIGKVMVRIGGGLVVASWVYVQFMRLLGTIDTDSKPHVTPLDELWLAGGVAMLIAPSFVSTDPLTGSERRALGTGGAPLAAR